MGRVLKIPCASAKPISRHTSFPSSADRRTTSQTPSPHHQRRRKKNSKRLPQRPFGIKYLGNRCDPRAQAFGSWSRSNKRVPFRGDFHFHSTPPWPLIYAPRNPHFRSDAEPPSLPSLTPSPPTFPEKASERPIRPPPSIRNLANLDWHHYRRF